LPHAPITRPITPFPTLVPYTTLFRSRSPRGRSTAQEVGKPHHSLQHPPASRRTTYSRPQNADDGEFELHVTLDSSPHLTDPVRRSEEHTSELQSRFDLVCRLLLERKN